MTKEDAKRTLQDMWECLFREMTNSTFDDLEEHGMLANYSKAFEMAMSALSEDKGEWKLGGYDDMYYVCSKCGFKASEYYAKPKFNFCPSCGLKMNREREEPEEIIGIGNADKMRKLIDNLIKAMDEEPKEEKEIE